MRLPARFRPFPSGLAVALVLAAGLAPDARSQDTAAKPDERPRPDAVEEKPRREREMKTLEEALAANAESRRRLEAEIASLKSDRANLNAALIETTERVHATEERI